MTGSAWRVLGDGESPSLTDSCLCSNELVSSNSEMFNTQRDVQETSINPSFSLDSLQHLAELSQMRTNIPGLSSAD